ncbi:MAG: hypothetical protein AAB288_01145, partial [Acidobacteriota bacterium]
NTGNITGAHNNIGGIVGYAVNTPDHQLTSSFNTGVIKGQSDVGGFCGYCAGTIKLSYSTGEVIGTGTGNHIGGFVGSTQRPGTVISLFEDDYATGSVSNGTTLTTQTGGFVGMAYSYVRFHRSYATGDVSGFTDVGGFAGRSNDAKITFDKVYASGKVVGTGDNHGGLVGYLQANATASDSVVKNCYARGSVDSNSNAGGLIGLSNGTVQTSYASGKVSQIVSNRNFGGLIGSLSSASAVNTNDFFDKITTDQTVSAAGTGKTTTDMKTVSTYSSFDPTIWSITAGSYPRLLWEPGVTP